MEDKKLDGKHGQPWGILDDSADLHRAIAVSDAYYGDASSVVSLYQKTGKPIVIQSISREHITQLCKGVLVDNMLISSFYYRNGIVFIDLCSGEVETYVIDIEDETLGYIKHCIDTKFDNEVFLLPHGSQNLIRFNLKTYSSVKIPIAGKYNVNFNRSFIYGGLLYLLPSRFPSIAALDLVTNEMLYYKLPLNANFDFIVVSSTFFENKVYILCKNPNCIVSFDCESKEYRKYEVKDKYSSICCTGSFLWLGGDNLITKMSLHCNFIEEYNKLPPDFKSGRIGCFNHIVDYGEYLIALSYNSNMVLRVNVQTGFIDELCLPDSEKEFYADSITGCYFLASRGKMLYLWSRYLKTIIQVDVNKNIYKVIDVDFSKVSFDEFNKKHTLDTPFRNRDYYAEKGVMTDLIYDVDYMISHIPYQFSPDTNHTDSAGKCIYNYLKNTLR